MYCLGKRSRVVTDNCYDASDGKSVIMPQIYAKVSAEEAYHFATQRVR